MPLTLTKSPGLMALSNINETQNKSLEYF